MRSLLPLHRLKIPLRLILVVPFVLLVAISVGLTNYFSLQNSRLQVQQLAHQLMMEVADRVHLYLDHYLEQPDQIDRSNTNAVRFGQLDPQNINAIERYLIWQISNFDHIQSIVYANEQGDLRIVKSIKGKRTLQITNSPDVRKFEQYAINSNGQPSKFIKMGQYPQTWDIRQQHWYKLAKQKKRKIWNSVYTLGDGTDLNINASLPVYDVNKKFIGVFELNLNLSGLNDFINQLQLRNTGVVFLMENNGSLITSSTDELPFIKTSDGKFKRILATQSQNPLIQAASRHLTSQFNLNEIDRLQQREFTENGKTYFSQVQPYKDKYGLNWTIVTVVPKSDFMAKIDINTQYTIRLTVLAAIITILLGILIANRIARPILTLSKTSAAIAQGNLNVQIPEHLPVRELDRMARSFNQMTQQLQSGFDRIQTNLRESEAKLSDIINSPIASIIQLRIFANGDWNIEYLSRGCETVFGYNPQEFLDDKSIWMSRIVPEDLETIILPLFNDVFAEKTVSFEYRFNRKDGSLRWLGARLTSRYDREGNCWFVNQFTIDISDRKTLERELAFREAQLNVLFNSAPLGINIIDDRLRFVKVNESMAEINGVPISEHIGKTIGDILPRLAPIVEPIYQQVLTTGQPILNLEVSGEVPLQPGAIRYWLASYFPIPNPENNATWVGTVVVDITERKLAEQALQKSEATNKALIAAIPDLLIRMSRNGTYLDFYAGSNFQIINPHQKREGVNLFDILPADRAQERLNYIQQALETDEIQTYEQQIVVEGKLQHEETRIVPIEGDEVLVIVRDITARKQAESALRQSESALAEAQKISHLGNWSFDIITQKIVWSEETFRIYGVDPSQLEPSYQKLLEFTHPDDIKLIDGNVKYAIAEGKNYEHEIRIFRPDGSMRYTLGKGQAVFDEAGQVVKLFGTVQDITERKLAEQALQKSEATNRALIAAIPDLLVHMHRDGTYLDDFYAEEDFNILYSQQERKKITIFDVLPAERAQKRFNYIQRAIKTGEVQTYEQELQIEDKLHYEETRIVPIQTDEVLLIVRDITARKQAEAELQKAKEAAEAANRAKSEFLANMSHEIRTPMNAILGFCDLLQNCITESQPRFYLQSIAASGKTLLALINDILDLSKIEAGKLQLHYDPLNLRVLIQEICLIFSQKAQEKQLYLLSEIDENLPTAILFDEVRLRQILFNVVGNALKFTESGSIKISARSQTRISENTVCLEIAVADTGIGIPTDQQNSIFDAFLQVEGQSTRKYGGTGLGLAIVKRLTQLLGGKVTLQTQLGHGSTFTFTFPEVSVTNSATESTVKSDLDNNLDIFKAATILAVDDVPSNLHLLQGYFAGTKHNLLLAKDGLEAINVALTHDIDLILLDWRMPNMDGGETSKVLQKDDRTKHIPIIMVTASVLKEEQEVLRSLCHGFILKPVSLQQLISELRRFLSLDETYLESNSEKAAIVPVSDISTMSPDALEKLPELLEKLQIEAETVLPNLCNSMIRRDLKKFAQRLKEWGTQYNCSLLLNYAETLVKQIDEFDFDRIPDTLKKFPDTIAALAKFLS
ncbi:MULTISPECIES: PAS domain S-box protein [Aerosakkonema]|uniref:PAS domain S-box protein n=1 Tax=Aerosakkonema TaxID=1246629 RepID=UPI0035BA06F3